MSFLFLVSLDKNQKEDYKKDDYKFEQLKRLLPSTGDYQKLDSFKHIDNKLTFILNKLLCVKAIDAFIKDKSYEFATNNTGKPILINDANVKFNMSNCVSENISTMIINNQNVEVGIDIANVNDHMGNDSSFDYTLYRDILSHVEMDLLSKQTDPNKTRLFALMWSIKESYTKLLGVGLNYANLSKVSVFENNATFDINQQNYKNINIDGDIVDFKVFWYGQQVISVCQKSNSSISLPLMIREVTVDSLNSSSSLSVLASSSFKLKKHNTYFSHFLGYLPAQTTSYDPNRFTIIYYALLSKYLLSDELKDAELYISYLKGLYLENMEFCGFTPNKEHFPRGIEHNIPQNFFAILNLLILGCKDFQFINVNKICKVVKKFLYETCDDLRDFYMGTSILFIFDNLNSTDLQKIIQIIENDCFIDDYGFTNFKKGDVHSGYISCIANIFQILKLKFDYDMSQEKKIFTFEWLCHRQIYDHKHTEYNGNGGFNGRENKKVDSCYSFWNFSAMSYFRMTEKNPYDLKLYEDYILKLQDPIKGGFAKHLVEDDDEEYLDSDVYHSFTTLCALGLIDGILDPTLCLPKNTLTLITNSDILFSK